MRKIKHTSGPWAIRSLNEEIGEYEIVGPRHSDETGESEYIAVVCGGLRESKANAYLIAAAPKLLEALEELLTAVDKACGTAIPQGAFGAARKAARDAIAKATGEQEEAA